MTIAHVASLGTLFSTGAATTYTAAGGSNPTGAANTLLVATVVVTGGSGEEPPTVAGHGATWSIVQSTLHGTTIRFITYQANGAGASTTKFSVSGFGSNRTGCAIAVNEISGIRTNTVGVGADNSVVQVATIASGTGTSGATNALAAYSHASNRPYACVEHIAGEATAVDASPATWAEIFDGNYSNPSQALEGAINASAQETTYTATWSTSSEWRSRIFELNGNTAQSVTVNQTTETDLAQVVTPLRIKASAQATETELAQTISAVRVRGITQPLESDLAQAITAVLSGQDVEVLQAVESDEAQLVRPAELHEVAQTVETDEATPVTWSRAFTIGQALETDEALGLGQSLEIGLAEETDVARELDLFKGTAGTGIVRSPNRVRISVRHNEVT